MATNTLSAITDSSAVSYRRITPGAGVDPRKVLRPGKRLRNWHRATKLGPYQSLRSYARHLAREDNTNREAQSIAKRWLRPNGASL